MTTTVEPPEKFYVFHNRHLWKSPNVEEGGSPAEYAVIAASNSKQNPCVMSKVVCESINQAPWEANSEVAAHEIRIVHDMRNLVQTSLWDFSVDMHEPKQVAAGGARPSVQLPGTTAIALDQLIAQSGGESLCPIGASAVCNNDLRFRRSLAKVPKKRRYRGRFVKDWDDD
jgi:hypothetical protein